MGAPADQPGPPLPLEVHKHLRPSRSLPSSLKRAASTHFHGPEPQPFLTPSPLRSSAPPKAVVSTPILGLPHWLCMALLSALLQHLSRTDQILALLCSTHAFSQRQLLPGAVGSSPCKLLSPLVPPAGRPVLSGTLCCPPASTPGTQAAQ